MHEFPPLNDCWFLTGATASGKTTVGMELAEALHAEVVSLDSMAVYRGMDIGTAKPCREQQDRVPHHLLDLVEPSESFSLAQYLETAHQVVQDIQSRGRQPMFVGGTPLYLKSLLRGVCEGPPADPDFRQQVEAEVKRVGMEALRQRLAQVDPLSAAKLHPNDMRRMIRALEVYKLTGTPMSHYQLQFEETSRSVCKRLFILSWPRTDLHNRINARVDAMFDAGLVEEVRGLLEDHGEFSDTAIQGVGYREVIRHLQGEFDLSEAIKLTQARTRQFARRQETWFRGLNEGQWISCDSASDNKSVAQRILAQAALSE